MNPHHQVRARTAHVLVIGRLWCGVDGAYRYNLSDRDLRDIREFTRESVERWLTRNAGDFERVYDFAAQCGDDEIAWERGDVSEAFYFGCVDGEDTETEFEQ